MDTGTFYGDTLEDFLTPRTNTMQDRLDGMEDPRWSTKQESFACAECSILISIEPVWFTGEYDFCCQDCFRDWFKKNWQIQKGHGRDRGPNEQERK